MTTPKARKFAIDVSWAFASSIITIPISFILRIFLARWLGASDLGLYQMVITIYSMTAMAATFGIPSSIIKFSAEYLDDHKNLNQYITTGILSSMFFGLVVSVVMYILSGVFSRIFHMPELAGLLKILSIIFPFTSIFQSSAALVNGLRKMRRFSSLIMLQSLSMILFTIVLVGMGFGLNGAIYGLVFSMVCSSLISLASAKQLFRFDIAGIKEKGCILLRYGSLLFGSDVMNVVATNIDIILIGFFLTKTDVGFYSVAITLSLILNLIPAAIQRITYPATSELFAKPDAKQFHIMLDKSMKYSTMINIPLGLAIGFFAIPMVTLLFGDKFIPSILPLYILLIGRVIRGSINAPIGGLYAGIGRPNIAFLLDLLASIASIVVMLILIPLMGITGAALSTTFSMVFGTLLFTSLMPRFINFRIDLRWYLHITVLAALAIAIFAISSFFMNRYAAGTFILVSLLSAIYRYCLEPDDVLFLKHYAATIRQRFL